MLFFLPRGGSPPKEGPGCAARWGEGSHRGKPTGLVEERVKQVGDKLSAMRPGPSVQTPKRQRRPYGLFMTDGPLGTSRPRTGEFSIIFFRLDWSTSTPRRDKNCECIGNGCGATKNRRLCLPLPSSCP